MVAGGTVVAVNVALDKKQREGHSLRNNRYLRSCSDNRCNTCVVVPAAADVADVAEAILHR